ncbi:hypothetical protein [Neolewinella antarctica]|uniref:Uncharacterized protein n=1 Tax=Neolewinella antarctica TaxID=442734 RepID=A0ABX0X762_9BACT|nr:hypothetical protein [Neolewinella antarctica]NJC24853.1 hypothetical protein [Neolewinella antarctica]
MRATLLYVLLFILPGFSTLIRGWETSLTGTLQAQNNWVSGHYVGEDGVRKDGQINANFIGNHVAELRFRASAEAPTQRLPLSELTAFELAGNRYLVRDIVFDTYGPELADTLETSGVDSVRAALHQLVGGRASLYEYVDKKGPVRYFAGVGGEAPRYLRHRNYNRREADGRLMAMQDFTYRVTLSEVLGECTSLINDLRRTKYERGSLLKLFSAYYDCLGEEPTRQLPKDRPILNAGVTLGGGIVRYRNYISLPTGNFDWGSAINTPTAAAGGFLEFKRLSTSSYSIRLAITYTASSVSKTGFTEREQKPKTLELSASSLDVRLGVKKLILQRKFPFYGEFGLASGFLLDVDDYRTYEFAPIVVPELRVPYSTGLDFGGYLRLSTNVGKANLGLLYQYKTQGNAPVENTSSAVLLLVGYGF